MFSIFNCHSAHVHVSKTLSFHKYNKTTYERRQFCILYLVKTGLERQEIQAWCTSGVDLALSLLTDLGNAQPELHWGLQINKKVLNVCLTKLRSDGNGRSFITSSTYRFGGTHHVHLIYSHLLNYCRNCCDGTLMCFTCNRSRNNGTVIKSFLISENQCQFLWKK